MPLPRSSEMGYNSAMPDELEARMKFIIEQQAKFEVDIQLLKERQEETARAQEETAKAIAANTAAIQGNATSIRGLVDVSLSLTRLIERLAEAQTNTEYKLNALIDTVDKLVRRDGGAG
jgi:chromosome segregation ATPase